MSACRAPVVRASFGRAAAALPGSDLVIDSFAGGGGASTGIERAIGRSPDIAINHSPRALAIHAANHPQTKHFCEDVWQVDPFVACSGRRPWFVWFSPDCRHHSRAKGGKPRNKKIRGLAWVVIRWAVAVRPEVIFLENVEEFAHWGPLDRDGNPVKHAAGRTFRAWVAKLRALGYSVEWRSLVAADYGTPTTRRRLFLVARADGGPIVWPEATHGVGRPNAWRPAADVIDWSQPVRSIFDRRQPLADATLERIALGVQRYVIHAAQPFVVPVTHQGAPRAHGLDAPPRTSTEAHRGERALVEPLIAGGWPTGSRGPGACAARGAQGPGAEQLVVPLITKHYGGVVGHELQQTLGTVTGRDHHALSAALLRRRRAAPSAQLELPMAAVPRAGVTDDLPGQRDAQVQAFLIKYYRAHKRDSAQSLFGPMHTITSKARFGLVTVRGVPYQIVDIGMRMLQPRELFRAQGFEADYIIDPLVEGKRLNKTDQIAAAGNSVCPQVAAALVRANVLQQARRSA